MTLQILLFGITTDLLGTSSINLDLPENSTITDLKLALANNYVAFKTLKAYAVAVNETYAQDDIVLQPKDIIAIIPPVSGG